MPGKQLSVAAQSASYGNIVGNLHEVILPGLMLKLFYHPSEVVLIKTLSEKKWLSQGNPKKVIRKRRFGRPIEVSVELSSEQFFDKFKDCVKIRSSLFSSKNSNILIRPFEIEYRTKIIIP